MVETELRRHTGILQPFFEAFARTRERLMFGQASAYAHLSCTDTSSGEGQREEIRRPLAFEALEELATVGRVRSSLTS